MIRQFFILLFFCSLPYQSVIAAVQTDTVQIADGEVLSNFGTKVRLLADPTQSLTAEKAIGSAGFEKVTSDVPNLGISNSAYWLRMVIKNKTSSDELTLQIPLPTLDKVDFFQFDGNTKLLRKEQMGDSRPYYSRSFDNPFSTFVFHLKKGETTTVLIRLSGGEQLQVPLILTKSEVIDKNNADAFLVFGMYAGIIVVMFIYNFFLFISTRDKTYLFYIIYIFFIGLLQANFQGFTFKYLWPANVTVSTYAVYILTPLAALTALEFMKKFLHSDVYVPRLNRWLNIFYIPYGIAVLLAFLGNLNVSYQLLQITAVIIAIAMLFTAWRVHRQGFQPAKYFILAWSFFLLGLCIFVLKDYNILPYNTLTYNMMPLGSAVEVTLLSFALADKINVYRKEKEQSQEEALRVLQENERLITEQNIQLERKVTERTVELQSANSSLEQTLKDLKDAQSQLVDAEKMAGLGQLTAGIAHEINNPINFVTSNIKPLELDIKDLREVISMYEKIDPARDLHEQLEAINSFKRQIDMAFVNEEINTLLSGIGEGARRTAEIIRSLKNFSRLDENDTKPVDLNEGLDSTLVLVRNIYPQNLKVIKNYDNLPKVECLPGKINQVFMNLVSNAIYAIKNKPEQREEEFLTITTRNLGDKVSISIKDSGTGMTEEVKNKIFEPFFTTKSVGEGTGLGLSIVFRIIETHKGTIEVLSTINVGTEFIITLPVNA
ncbi:7TM diverse intracellular signaling domain-containing protein [Pedobacter sp. SYP-B3415]|uniref:sensor histidine kinase n=1 Tax=Pedobacter sp. SYP-B3415 TaxID=2496641 RepID=UPI00101C57F1|nr:7TM diverse intracellular signaling domain-containing protein [Pedobacter sp. SYP-B3415]